MKNLLVEYIEAAKGNIDVYPRYNIRLEVAIGRSFMRDRILDNIYEIIRKTINNERSVETVRGYVNLNATES